MSQAVGAKASPLALPSFRRILLVTDFSPCSEAAVPFTRLMAQSYRASIAVAHVIPGEADAAVPPAEAEQARQAAEERMRAFLQDNALGSVPATIGVGPVWDVLAKIIAEQQMDLVVLGTHGRSGVGKLLLGSIAQRIFNVAPCPVLSVSPRAQHSWQAGGKLSRILYAASFSQASLKALPYAMSLAKTTGAELLLVHAPQDSSTDPLTDEAIQRLHQQLAQLIPSPARVWCRFDTLVIPGDPAHVILKAATQHNADFIIIGARAIGPGPLYPVNVPLSTAYQVVAHAHCPVLRVRE